MASKLHQLYLLDLLLKLQDDFVAAVARAPLYQKLNILLVVGSNPVGGHKSACNFFSTQIFLCFLTCIELVIPLGMFTNHVDRQRGGGSN